MGHSGSAGRPPDDDPLAKARGDLVQAMDDLDGERPTDSAQDTSLSRLLSVTQQINAELEIEGVLAAATRQLIDLFEAESVFIVETAGEDRLVFRAAVTFKGDTIPNPQNEVSHALIREVALKREPVLVTNAQEDARFAEVSSVQELQLHSVMAAPLLARGELMGVVYADNRLLSGAFNSRKLNLLGLFASHVGVALRNARLFQELTDTRAELAQSERLRAIGEVATFFAHKVKNPLASIQILIDALRERWTDHELREKVFQVVPHEVARLNQAVATILDYARPTPLIRVPLNLAALVKSALRTMEGEAAEREVNVVMNAQPELPQVLADGERLREVFVNLIKNAIEAVAGRTERRLHVALRQSDEAHVEITFDDSGYGIPEAQRESIFEPFVSSKKAGTGIGLALCRKLVREHGGSIVAGPSELGGASFRIVFPISGT
jgi:signal transduction histidine kinase